MATMLAQIIWEHPHKDFFLQITIRTNEEKLIEHGVFNTTFGCLMLPCRMFGLFNKTKL